MTAVNRLRSKEGLLSDGPWVVSELKPTMSRLQQEDRVDVVFHLFSDHPKVLEELGRTLTRFDVVTKSSVCSELVGQTGLLFNLSVGLRDLTRLQRELKNNFPVRLKELPNLTESMGEHDLHANFKLSLFTNNTPFHAILQLLLTLADLPVRVVNLSSATGTTVNGGWENADVRLRVPDTLTATELWRPLHALAELNKWELTLEHIENQQLRFRCERPTDQPAPRSSKKRSMDRVICKV